MNLAKYEVEDFIKDGFGSSDEGFAELLISQSRVADYTNGADLSSSQYSWPYIQSMSAAMWNTETTGSVGPGFITGLKVKFKDNTGADNRRSFQICNSLALTIDAGGLIQTLVFNIKERQLRGDYAYFKVENYPLIAISGVTFVFSKDANDNFLGYTCNASNDDSPITFVVEPYFSAEENSIFNPIINNVVEGVVSSIAKVVEPNTGWASLWGVTRIVDGEYADMTASVTYSGDSASWSSGDPVNTIDGMYMPSYPVSLMVQPAEIPDYFYTALSSISGRFLGSKSGYELKARKASAISSSQVIKEFISNYTGNYATEPSGSYELTIRYLTKHTLDLLQDNIRTGFSGSLPQTSSSTSESVTTMSYAEVGVDPAFFTAQEFQGSVYSVDAKDIPDIKDMEFGTIKFSTGTVLESTLYTGSISGSASIWSYRRTYNRNNNPSGEYAASLPIIGDVIYSADLSKRLPNSKIFIQESNQVLLTNEFASVIEISSGSAA